MPTKKKSSKSSIETSHESLEQRDWLDTEFMEKHEKRYSRAIGSFLIHFGILEHSLDTAIAELIDQTGHHMGYLIIKKLTMKQKIDLFYDLGNSMVKIIGKHPKRRINKLKKVNHGLCELNTLRNKIAHAKWGSLDRDGYVRVEIQIDEDDGFIKFKKYKITPRMIGKAKTQIEKLSEKLDEIVENLYYF